MAKLGCVVIAVGLILAACGGESPGERPQEYQFDQDIDASHGAAIPTSINQGSRGFENWRMKDPDTYGHSQGFQP